MAETHLASLVRSSLSSLHYSALILSAAPLVCLLGFVFYQLYLHPLAKYPGPLVGRITPLYDLYHAYKGDKHVLLYQLHQKCGRFVRFTPNTLSINDPAALKSIYGHTANCRKSEFYRCFRATPTAISTLLATEKAHHARKRRVMAQAFSDSAMKNLEVYVQEHIQALIDKVGATVKQPTGSKKWSKPLDMQKWCNWLVFDIMGDLVFGKSLNTLGGDQDSRYAIHLLGRAARRNYAVAAVPPLAHWGVEKWLPPFKSLYQDRNDYLDFGKKQVWARTAREKESPSAESQRKDIYSFLLSAKDPETGEGFPTPELWMEGNTLIVAGSDTSSTTLAATLFYLMKNPLTLTRLEKEVRSTFNDSSDIRMGTQLQSLTWLRACIDEAMRMSPAVPGLLPREVLTGGLEIPALKMHLPAGVNVGVCIYAVHHHADYVVNPFSYDPARWLQNGHQQNKEALQAVFNPFSLGHRACLGKPLVYMELMIAIARLVFEFDMRLSNDQHEQPFITKEIKQGKRNPVEYQYEDWFLSNNYGPYAEFRVRDAEDRIDSAH